MIIQKLRPFVTSFSEAIAKQFENGTEVCVGGEVKSIVDMTEFSYTDEKGKVQQLQEVHITLDDGVGLNHVVLAQPAYQTFKDTYGIHKGMVVLAVGRIMKLTIAEYDKAEGHYKPINHPEATTRIAGYYMSPVPELKCSN